MTNTYDWMDYSTYCKICDIRYIGDRKSICPMCLLKQELEKIREERDELEELFIRSDLSDEW